MVVAVEYISKEESTDVAEGAASAQHGVTGILAVQGAFAEHAAMLDRLGAPWKLLRAAEDFDDSIDRVILPGGESTTQGKLLRSTGLFEPIAEHIAAGKPVFGSLVVSITTRTSILARWMRSCAAMRMDVSLVRSLRPPILVPLLAISPFRLRRGSAFRKVPLPSLLCSRISLWCSFADRSLPRLASGPRSKRRSTAMWSVCVRARFSLRRSTRN